MHSLIPRDWKTLPDAIRNRLGDGPGRQRAMVAEGHLLLVLHAVPEPGSSVRTGRLFWRAPDGFWRDDQGNHGAEEVGRLIDAYKTAAEAVEDRIAGADAAEDYFAALRAGRPLSRSLRHLVQAVQDAREQIADPALIRLRDAAAAAERTAELALADAQSGLDFTVARRVEEHARAQHRLNILAAVFFPVTAIATIMGMNLKHGFEDGPFWWFWAATILAFVAGFAVRVLVVKPTAPPAERGRPARRKR